jgi:hypothetical protein
MPNRVQTLRSSVPGNLPQTATRSPGELWVNFADAHIGYIDAAQTAQKVLAVRLFVTTASYAVGDFVVYAGALYCATAPSAAGAFTAANWTRLGTMQDLSQYLPLAGGTLTGPLTLAGAPANANQAANRGYVDAGDAAATAVANSKLPLAGGTLTGLLTLSGPPTQPLQAATKAYVDSGAFLPISGGTLTGPLNGTSASFSTSTYTPSAACGALEVTNGQVIIDKGSAVNPVLWFYDGSTNRVAFYFIVATGQSTWSDQYSGVNIQMGPSNVMNLNAGAINLSGNATVAGTLNANSGTCNVKSSGGSPAIQLLNSAGAAIAQFYYNISNGNTYLTNAAYGSSIGLLQDVTIAPLGGHNFIVSPGQGYQAGSINWGLLSDERIKSVTGEYMSGLEEVLQLRPVTYTYKGNDTPTADVSTPPARLPDDPTPLIEVVEAPYPSSMHYHAALEQKPFVGFIAQELELSFPEMVSQHDGFINGQAVTDLRHVDTSPLIYALVNAVKTLAARVEDLEAMVIPR